MIDDDRYLEVHSLDDIRVKGMRVGVEHLLSAYLAGGLPEELCVDYPTVTLEQVHGILAWYLRNREEADAYMAARYADGRQARRQQSRRSIAPVVTRLRRLCGTSAGRSGPDLRGIGRF